MPRTRQTPCYIPPDLKARIQRCVDRTGGSSVSNFLVRQAIYAVELWEKSQGLSHILPEQEAAAS